MAASRGDPAAQFVRDMGVDDVVERGLGLKAERQGASGIEPARPAGDDARYKGIGFAADAAGNLVTSDAAQCGDLLDRKSVV